MGKDGLKLHQDPSVAVLAINCVRSRGGGDGRALGGGGGGGAAGGGKYTMWITSKCGENE